MANQMAPPRVEAWERIQELFAAAVDLPPKERAAFLDRECYGDATLRREVQSLIDSDAQATSFIEDPASAIPPGLLSEPEPETSLAGRHFGPYEIVREIGRGGLGAVYLAIRSDGEYRKEVAVKLIRRGLDTEDILRRFRNERQILAQLDHPNIARLVDGGTTDDGLPFFVMEYVKGEPISAYCDTHRLDTHQRLELFRKVCGAVTYAHQNLVIHRDLKPSNILVAADGEPKLLDFGIAKLLTAGDEPMFTQTAPALRAMTPEYASPEQIRGERITTASDVYTLGVLLYELLTGQKPYRLKTRTSEEIARAITDQEPERPSTAITRAAVSAESALHNPQALRGDLDNIVLMAMRKEPHRRYASAATLADDIRRHQEGLPVAARPNTFSYRAGKFIARHRLGVAAAAVVMLAIIGGMIATLWQAGVARAERGRAETERTRAEKRFNDVRSLAASFLFEFSPLIENLPGSMPARELLVRRALEYLDSLSRETGDDPGLQRELAAAYAKVGDVQGNPYNPNLGDIQGALNSYEKARAIRQRLWEQEPGNAQAQSDLANVFKLIGDTHSNGGKYAEAAGAYDRALELREKIVAQNPRDFEARGKLAEIVRARGLIPFFEGDNKKAIEFYSRARELNEQLLREQPDNAKIADQYSYTFVMIGEAQGWDNDVASAATNLQTGLELLTALAEKHPHDASIQRSVMLANNKRAENHQDRKEFDQSIALFSKGVEIAQKLLAADPQSFQAKRDVAIGNKKLAQALDEAGRSSESLEKLAVALKSFQEMSAADPNNTEYPYDAANTRLSIGETYVSLQEYESALRAYLQAKEEFEAVLARNPDNIYVVRMMSYNLLGMGKSYVALAERGNRQELLQKALESRRAALEIFKRLKASGNLSEVDSKIIEETEAEIAKVESDLNRS